MFPSRRQFCQPETNAALLARPRKEAKKKVTGSEITEIGERKWGEMFPFPGGIFFVCFWVLRERFYLEFHTAVKCKVQMVVWLWYFLWKETEGRLFIVEWLTVIVDSKLEKYDRKTTCTTKGTIAVVRWYERIISLWLGKLWIFKGKPFFKKNSGLDTKLYDNDLVLQSLKMFKFFPIPDKILHPFGNLLPVGHSRHWRRKYFVLYL